MSQLFDKDEQIRALERMYVYDPVNHVGFPVTHDILTVDIDSLSYEERILLSMGEPGPVKELLEKKGDTLINQFSLATRVFSILVHKLIKSEPEEKQLEVVEIIRKALETITEEGFDES